MNDKVEAVKAEVEKPIAAVEAVPEAIKTYVRDELGRFAKKESEVKEAAVEVAAEVAGTPMQELPAEQLKDVVGGDLPRGGITSGDGPHGSW